MSFRKTLLAATVIALPLGAQAQTVNGLYIAGGAGVNWMGNASSGSIIIPDRNGSIYNTPGFTNYGPLNVSFNTGWGALASLGWGFGNGLRAEGEISYRYNGVNRVRANGNPVYSNPGEGGSGNWCSGPNCIATRGSSGGSVTNIALMANLFYDFNFGWVMPYLGAGMGASMVGWNNVTGNAGVIYGTTDNGQENFRYRANGSSLQFAYQFIGGLAFPIAAVPGLAITAEYRYFATLSPSVNTTVWNSYTCCQGQYASNNFQGSTRLSFDNTHQTLLVGVRYNFGQRAAAPAPVAAAPAPARSYLVFFDFNSDQLTPRAREIVGQAAQAARSQQVTRIEVSGHTDTVGSAQYNQGLSLRRANNVAAELVSRGVPRNAIQTAGFGFSRPLVPTGPNVREPQNRRVEIVFP